MTTIVSRLAAVAAFLITSLTCASAAEIKVLSTVGVKHVLEELKPKFEQVSGHKLNIIWGTGASLAKQMQDGERTDIAILTRQGLDSVLKSGKVIAGSERNFASSRIGVAVPKGAPKPDISTPEALKAALLAAKAISYPDPARGGVAATHLLKVAEGLGITDQVKAKAKHAPSGMSADLLANGEADIAVQQIPEMVMPGVEVVGPFPGNFDLVTIFAGAVGAETPHPDAAKALLDFLQAPEAATLFKANGYDPPPPATKAT
jgi:molybdate transport system substrate-binding protein